MKKKVFMIGASVGVAIVALVAVILIVVFTREGVSVRSVSGRNVSISNAENNTWTVTADTLTGNSRMDITFTEESLDALRIHSTSSGGTVSLRLTQGDVDLTFDITQVSNHRVNLNGFTPGRIRMRLAFDRLENVSLSIAW
jgi:hypothetical protein